MNRPLRLFRYIQENSLVGYYDMDNGLPNWFQGVYVPNHLFHPFVDLMFLVESKCVLVD